MATISHEIESKPSGAHPAAYDEWLVAAADEVLETARAHASRLRLPRATYRVQLNGDFGFAAAASIVDYLDALGISDVYASPYLRAQPGSPHGYDIVDHSQLNPELGSEADFEAFVTALKRAGMGHILDVVPNHMGVATDANSWWQDVLENGPGSAYSAFFDIDWKPLKEDLAGKVLLPVLGHQFGQVLEDQELILHFAEGAFFLTAYGRRFPIAPKSFATILRHGVDELERQLGSDDPKYQEYQSILTAIEHLPTRDETAPERIAERQREKEVIKRRLRQLCLDAPEIDAVVQRTVARFNGRRGDPSSFDLLDALLQEQAYRLCFWQVAADEINYRRFFDVNELAAVCMERPEVFQSAHALVFRLIEQDQLNGLRIDHADGLYDPAGYLWNLQETRFCQLARQAHGELAARQRGAGDGSERGWPEWDELEPLLASRFAQLRQQASGDAVARPLYVIVEKILDANERLPGDWPTHGTTGYEFLNELNGLFVDERHARAFESVYARFIGRRVRFDDLAYEAKKQIMTFSLSSELNVLGHQLDRLSERGRWSRDFTLNGLTHALGEVVACFPVYRTYVTPEGVLERDRQFVQQAVARAKRRNPAVSQAVFEFIRRVLLLEGIEAADAEQRDDWLRFVGRLQQYTGPVMAKGLEDTAFYCYHCLASLNEVGGNPIRFGVAPAAFHLENAERRAHRPFGLLATSTHDTKRSEDARARINVLSEIPRSWRERVFQWTRWNKRKKTKVDGEWAPSRDDEYLLYQSLVGTWPFRAPHGAELTEYITRIQQYMLKAVREAKVHTSWVDPYAPYENAVCDFVAAILGDEPLSAFRTDFEPFVANVTRSGVWNSLSQTLLKLTSPGVPDLYQGTEILDFSLVDPDNRRSVDYALRRRLLDSLAARDGSRAERQALVRELLADPADGRIKLYVVVQALQARRQAPELFSSGDYLPLEAEGARSMYVCAFMRRQGPRAAVAVAPRLVHGLCGGEAPLGPVWEDTALGLPAELAHATWRNELTGDEMKADARQRLAVREALALFPVALLTATIEHEAPLAESACAP